MTKKKKWLIGIGTGVGITLIILVIVASIMVHRMDPYIRQQVVLYLQKRFDSEVKIDALSIHMPRASSLRMLLTRRRGALAGVDGQGVELRLKGRRDVPPMFVMKSFSFEVDLAGLFDKTKLVQNVTIDGMQINIPPKGQRPDLGGSDNKSDQGSASANNDNNNSNNDDDSADKDSGGWQNNVIIEEVDITNSSLTILPSDPSKKPLSFALHQIRLESAGKGVAMKYAGALTNAKPPGEIFTTGTFGPWSADDPGNSPIAGNYDFDKADLGVFAGIAGILHSTGSFQGTLSSIDVTGEASVPKFSLTRSGNPVPLTTSFQVRVDGTNGDTILKPVVGTLGTTTFTTSGAVIKNDEGTHRSISLDVTMPKGNIADLLVLAMKGPTFMEGQISLKTKIIIPPLSGTVRQKLFLEGTFEITDGKFMKSTIQNQIDSLSRRSQGQPQNKEIDQVVSRMGGRFKLDDEVIHFTPVSFYVPGSGIDLSGSYDLNKDILDFKGTMRMQATISQSMTGWKHWVLKPLDPFFSKEGSGTLLNIKVGGSSTQPKFGLNF